MISRRISAFRGTSVLILAIVLSGAFAGASCAQSDSIDVHNSGGSDNSGGQGGQGVGGADQGGGGGVFGAGGAGGGEACDPAEVCDGIDNDCNGQIDEGCDCKTGMKQPCYGGMPANTAGIGACKSGTQTCDQSGAWGACVGEITPVAEACNSVDDDCDGQTDEDMGTTSCGVGACQVTVPACDNGVKPPCAPLQPSVEVCDGLDNNCNQLVDETYAEKDKPCDTGDQGVCAAGAYSCLAGVLTCVQAMMSSAEVCDALDNNCNGAVDDVPGTGVGCSTGLPGVCSSGTSACSNGAVDCVPNTQPTPEACDGLDNNCNGSADEGIPPSGMCQTGMGGACASGNFVCQGGSLVCKPAALGDPEVCNGADDNCDGQADEGNPGGGAACTIAGAQGPCANGTTACSGGAPACNQTVQPAAETCGNSVDDDCDGTVDNGCAAGCEHNKCVTGGPLTIGCDLCVAQVCLNSPACCILSWSASCVSKVTSICGLSCP